MPVHQAGALFGQREKRGRAHLPAGQGVAKIGNFSMRQEDVEDRAVVPTKIFSQAMQSVLRPERRASREIEEPETVPAAPGCAGPWERTAPLVIPRFNRGACFGVAAPASIDAEFMSRRFLLSWLWSGSGGAGRVGGREWPPRPRRPPRPGAIRRRSPGRRRRAAGAESHCLCPARAGRDCAAGALSSCGAASRRPSRTKRTRWCST